MSQQSAQKNHSVAHSSQPWYLQQRTLIFVFAGILGVVSTIVIALPYMPGIAFRLHPPNTENIPYALSQPELLGLSSEHNSVTYIPDENRLVIPKIGVNAEILEGQSLDVQNVHEGVWRDPDTKDPLRGGNMVISGHRFQYTPPNTNTLYNVDKLATGDRFITYWDGKDYVYEVYNIFEVWPQEIGILDDSAEDEITLYTCTPIGSTEKRLVIKAKKLEQDTSNPIAYQ